jgi:NAD(P)-dependent dehydrogenase (short-subunit alcohol dehydrogenase family)
LDFVDRTYGKLHILFNHAGVQSPVGLDITEEEFDHVIDVNLKSLFFATSFAVPLMRRCAPHASIIFTSSTAALRAGRSPLYGATKAATLMLMRSVARQLGPDLIRANAICPGPTDTGFARKFASIAGMDDAAYKQTLEASSRSIPLGRVAAPNDVSGTVLFLASDQSMYLTGVSIPVDGGLTV